MRASSRQRASRAVRGGRRSAPAAPPRGRAAPEARAATLSLVRDLLDAPSFAAWWADFSGALAATAEARTRAADLAAQIDVAAVREARARRAAAAASRGGAPSGAAGSLEVALVALDRALEAGRRRDEAVRLLAEAAERRARAERLRADLAAAERDLDAAAAQRDAVLAAARERFGCLAAPSFLAWRDGDEAGAGWAIVLQASGEGARALRPLALCRVRLDGRGAALEALGTSGA